MSAKPKTKKLKKKAGGKKGNETKKKDGDQLATLNENDGEIDFETLVRKEYMRLHRQYRLMENARKAIVEKGKHLSKQGRLMDLLRAEKEDLETDLKNADSPRYHAIDKESIRTILGILEFFERCQADINLCLKNIAEMTDNVDKITKRLIQQKLKVMALYGHSLTVPQAENRKRKLEDRLYNQTTRFDTKVSTNKGLREEINMMLKLRGIFYERLVFMKKQISTARNKMGEVVFLATTAYEQRDDWVAKINMLREKNDKECKQHVLETKEFTRALHHDAKLHGFMALKNKERELMESHQQRTERKNLAKLQELDQTLYAYSQSLKQILNIAQFESMERLVASYNAQEQDNFSCFKCITDINHEVVVLKDSAIEMQNGIDEMYLESKKVEKGMKEELLSLGDTYEAANLQLDSILNLWENAEIQMSGVIQHLDAVFTIAECSNAPIVRLLGNAEGISPRNATLCMSVIESRVNELLSQKAELEMRKQVELEGSSTALLKKATTNAPSSKLKTAGGPFVPQVIVTGRLDGDEEEEEEDDKSFYQRPMTFQEMKTRILEKLAVRHTDSRATRLSSDADLMAESMAVMSVAALPNLH